MPKNRLIGGASLIAICISIYGMLKIAFDTRLMQSAPSTPIATTASSTPNILPVSTAPRPEPTTEPTPTPTPELTLTPKPTPTPELTLTPKPTPTPELTLTPKPTSTPELTSARKLLKSREVKHQPDQFRKGALRKEELSAIKKALKNIQWSRNSDPKAAADEDYAAILKECQNSNLHYLLTDLITEAASNDYQPGNQAANSTYITELISDFGTGVKDERAAQKPRSQR
jgi:hypothetical protein